MYETIFDGEAVDPGMVLDLSFECSSFCLFGCKIV